MSPALITMILLAAGAIQSLVPFEFPLLLSLLILITLYSRKKFSFYAAVLAGLIHDSFCPAPLGVSIPFYVLMVAGIQYIRREIFADVFSTYAILGGLFSLLKTVYFILIFSLTGIRPVRTAELLIQLAAGVVAALILAPLVYFAASPFRHTWQRRAMR